MIKKILPVIMDLHNQAREDNNRKIEELIEKLEHTAPHNIDVLMKLIDLMEQDNGESFTRDMLRLIETYEKK